MAEVTSQNKNNSIENIGISWIIKKIKGNKQVVEILVNVEGM